MDTINFQQNDPNYPSALNKHLAEDAPDIITGLGNIDILRHNSAALFCSAKCPGDLILKTYDLAQIIRQSGMTVIGGFHSPMETECLTILLRGTQPVIICPARNINGMRIIKEYGQGFSLRNLGDMRRFYEYFTIRQALPAESKGPLPIDFRSHSHLGWTHYRILLGIKDNVKRRFYFEQAAHERWSTRELLRKINGALFERVALSRDTKGLVALEQKKGAPEVTAYEDIFKDPYLLDFLGLKGAYLEKDMEAAIIHNLEQFLSELGSDFCFMARQYPMRIDDVDYFLDLLFYHRGLRCLVAIDLKLGTFSAADKGQMDLYLAWLKENEWRVGENEPVGLILCSSKKRQHVEMLIRHGPHKIQVSEYITKLPSKKVLEERLKIYSKLLREQ